MLNNKDLTHSALSNSSKGNQICNKIFAEVFQPNKLECARLTPFVDFVQNCDMKNIDFNATIEQGYYQGASLLHILVTMVIENSSPELNWKAWIRIKEINYSHRCVAGIYKNKSAFEIILDYFYTHESHTSNVKHQRAYALLRQLIQNKLINENSLNQEIITGELKGRTPLCFIASRTLKYPKLMRTILFSYNINQLNFNAKINQGMEMGKSPLWYIAEAAATFPDIFECALEHGPIEEYDFNVCPKNGNLKGKTITHWVAERSITHKNFLKCVVDKASLSSINFNVKTYGQKRDSPLQFLIKASFKDTKLLPFLEQLIHKIPEKLDFGSQLEGLSCFSMLCKHTLQAKSFTTAISTIFRIISTILEKVPPENIGINSRSQRYKDETPFLYLAKLAQRYPAPLLFVLEHFSFHQLDFSAKDTTTQCSVLWFIVCASMHNPTLLITLIRRFPVEKLDFKETVMFSAGGKLTIRSWIAQQGLLKPMGLKIDFQILHNQCLNHWAEHHNALHQQNGYNFAIALEELERLADLAQPYYKDTYYQLANLYATIDDIENLKKLAFRVEEDNPHRDKIFTLLSHALVKDVTKMNPNEPIARSARKRKLLEACSMALEIRHDPTHLKALLAFNYIYNFKHSLDPQKYDNKKLLDNLNGDYNTSLTALHTVKAKVSLEEEYRSINLQNEMLKKEITHLYSKQMISEPLRNRNGYEMHEDCEVDKERKQPRVF